MKCPFCSSPDTQVIDSRVSEEGDTIRRRRRCSACDKRFTTYERVELTMPALVKRNGTRVEYDRSTQDVDAAVARIEESLLVSGQREVDSRYVGGLVMDELKKLDQVAYVRFASVYKSFDDIREFVKAIDEINVPSKS